MASVWQLPVLFCIENNGYGLSTPTSEQYNCENLADRGKGYGMESHIIDGNNILEVYSKVKSLVEDMREHPRPVLLEFKTFRMRGHEEASGTKYVPDELMDQWGQRDPLLNFENYLIAEGLLTETKIETLTTEIKNEINENLDIAFAEETIASTKSVELNDVFKAFEYQEVKSNNKTEELRVVDAISQGLRQSMEYLKLPKVLLKHLAKNACVILLFAKAL